MILSKEKAPKEIKKHITGLKEGDKAPDFTSKDQNGNKISLSDFKGKKLVLYFYPKDNTLGCTAQSCNLRDNYHSFLNKGYAVVGVSVDDEKKHQKFIKKYALPFPLIADTDHQLVDAYDVWAWKTMFGVKFQGIVRTTFVISEQGIIERVISDVNTTEHTKQIL